MHRRLCADSDKIPEGGTSLLIFSISLGKNENYKNCVDPKQHTERKEEGRHSLSSLRRRDYALSYSSSQSTFLKILLVRALFALVIWWRSADHIWSCQMLYSMQRSRTRHTPSLECRQDRQIPAKLSCAYGYTLNPDPDSDPDPAFQGSQNPDPIQGLMTKN
jgi:hypothetical protein